MAVVRRNDTSTPARTFATLADAAGDPKSAPNGNIFVRVTDGVRVRLQTERLEANGNVPAAMLAIAIQENETGPRVHRVRNHLAAARFQTQLLLDAPDAGPEAVRRAESIADLIRLAGEALDPDPHAPQE